MLSNFIALMEVIDEYFHICRFFSLGDIKYFWHRNQFYLFNLEMLQIPAHLHAIFTVSEVLELHS